MNCYYCDRIKAADPGYTRQNAAFDLGSAAPRCARHWRYLCGRCGQPGHFMAMAWDPTVGQFYCARCAGEHRIVEERFWAWGYWFSYRSPFTESWHPGLDRLEFEGLHPLQRYTGGHHPSLSTEPYLVRYPERPMSWPLDHAPDDEEIRRSWNANAQRWDEGYDDDGDRNRRFQSDEPMLELLGEVRGLAVLDAGSGNGYLARKLARQGAIVSGVEQSDRFHEMAVQREAAEPLGITYRNASIAAMPFFADGTFDKAVSNYVLMDVRDWTQAIAELARVLRPGGVLVAVISHPCFSCGPGGWLRPAPDSPRTEERSGRIVDEYFRAGPMAVQWGRFDPVLSFHRPLQDYWQRFTSSGFTIDAFVEPSVNARGRRELSAVEIAKALRIPYSCIFRLVRQ